MYSKTQKIIMAILITMLGAVPLLSWLRTQNYHWIIYEILWLSPVVIIILIDYLLFEEPAEKKRKMDSERVVK